MGAPFPALHELDMPITSTAADSQRAVERMCAEGVTAIVVLGGDGTHRVVAKACGDVPICALVDGFRHECRAVDLSPTGMVLERTRALAARELS